MFARAHGAEVHLLGRTERRAAFARTPRLRAASGSTSDLPVLPWDAVIEASNAATLPALALDLVEPGKRVVYIGLAGTPSSVDTRTLALKDVTAVGILSALGRSGGRHRSTSPLATLTRARWSPRRSDSSTSVRCWQAYVRPVPDPGPKIHVDPRR